jgi:hypothetical protein
MLLGIRIGRRSETKNKISRLAKLYRNNLHQYDQWLIIAM